MLFNRDLAGEEIKELLADFRNKRALGLGSLFGDHQLEGTLWNYILCFDINVACRNCPLNIKF